MIDAQINESTAIIRVVSGKLYVTYEVKPGSFLTANGKRVAGQGFILDLAGIDRSGKTVIGTPAFERPYIFAAADFETVVRRGLSKARRLERAWAKTGVAA